MKIKAEPYNFENILARNNGRYPGLSNDERRALALLLILRSNYSSLKNWNIKRKNGLFIKERLQETSALSGILAPIILAAEDKHFPSALLSESGVIILVGDVYNPDHQPLVDLNIQHEFGHGQVKKLMKLSPRQQEFFADAFAALRIGTEISAEIMRGAIQQISEDCKLSWEEVYKRKTKEYPSFEERIKRLEKRAENPGWERFIRGERQMCELAAFIKAERY